MTIPFKIALFGALALSALTAQAGTFTVETDRATFQTGLGSYTLEDFTSQAHFPIASGVLNSNTNQPDIFIFPGLIKPGVTYSTPIGSGFFFNIDSGVGFDGGFLDTLDGLLLTVTFDTPVAGFGFDTSFVAPGLSVTVNFTDGTSQSYQAAVTSRLPTFFGFSASGAEIQSAVIGDPTNGGFSFAVDNFTFGSVASGVPEPKTYGAALAGLGVVGLMAGRRQRRAGG